MRAASLRCGRRRSTRPAVGARFLPTRMPLPPALFAARLQRLQCSPLGGGARYGLKDEKRVRERPAQATRDGRKHARHLEATTHCAYASSAGGGVVGLVRSSTRESRARLRSSGAACSHGLRRELAGRKRAVPRGARRTTPSNDSTSGRGPPGRHQEDTACSTNGITVVGAIAVLAPAAGSCADHRDHGGRRRQAQAGAARQGQLAAGQKEDCQQFRRAERSPPPAGEPVARWRPAMQAP